VVDGTPLEQFAFLNRAEVETLKVHGIFTVEALAAVEDDKAIQLGLAEEKQLAEKFLQQAKDNLSLKRWQKKEEEYLAKIRCLEEEIAALKKGKAAGSGKMKKEREKK